MPKRVAVIDLGSNSLRMAIFERTSRLGFFILRQYKIKVRLGHGAYENNGVLQDEAMQNVINAFGEFKNYIKLYKVRKVIAAGTSALRDAPNAKNFVKRVQDELGISLRITDGKTEAFLGGIAALNLLPNINDALCVDIGGGSTELAKICNGKITHTLSLNIGTVRLKELFYDKNNEKGAENFIKNLIENIGEDFNSNQIIAIGGSLRAISNAIMSKNNYPLKILHAFTYDLKKYENFIKKLTTAKDSELKELGIKKDRFDTINQGATIFREIYQKVGAKNVITSGVGIREGLFLLSILRPALKFPANFNPSLKSLQERFCVIDNKKIVNTARKLFISLTPIHKLGNNELSLLSTAAKIFNIGRAIGYYTEEKNTAFIAISALNFGFSHEQICTIASICELNGKDFTKDDIGKFDSIILNKPNSFEKLRWLCFLLALARNIGVYENINIEFKDKVLHINNSKSLPLLKEIIKKLNMPANFDISFN